MGKATALDDDLTAQPLTSMERAARMAAVALGDADVQPTLNGDLVKDGSFEPVVRVDKRPWD